MSENVRVKSIGQSFTMVPNAPLLDTELPLAAKGVLVALCSFANNDDKSGFPSYQTIADRASCSRSTALRAIETLVDRGYVLKETRKNKSSSNVYTVRFDIPTGVTETPVGVSQRHSRGVTETPELDSGNYTNKNYIGGTDEPQTNTAGKPKADSPSPTFLKLWENRASGKRRDTNRKKAWKHYKARLRDGYTEEQLEQSYKAYVEVCKSEGRTAQYIKKMEFFFSDEGQVEGYLNVEDDEESSEGSGEWVTCPDCGIEFEAKEPSPHLTACPGCKLEVQHFWDTKEVRDRHREMIRRYEEREKESIRRYEG